MIVKVGGKAAAKPPAEPKSQQDQKEDKKRKCGEWCAGDPWLYCCVLWCACAMSLVSSGYSLHRQQALAGRLALLEDQQRALRAAVLEPQQPLVERLRREVLARPPPSLWRQARSIRDYSDCVCPPGQSSMQCVAAAGISRG